MTTRAEDIELNEKRQEDRVDEQAQQDEETSFIRDDNFKDDFERLRSDFLRFGKYNFDLEHNGKDGYNITFPDLGDVDNTFDLEDEREEIRRKINYVGLIRVFERLMSSGGFRASRPPSYDFLKRNMFLDRIDVTFNKEGRIIGLSYKTNTDRPFNIIVKKPGANPNDLIFSESTNPKDGIPDAIDKFKREFSRLKEEYENTPSEITQELVKDDNSGGGSDNTSVLSDEQIWGENELIARTRREVFEEAEGKMEEYRDGILQSILNEADGENPFPDTADGTSFHDHAVFITDMISNMDWFEEEAWSIEGRRPPDERYETEMNIIYNARKDIKERIKKATSGKQIMTYETLSGYLDYKELSLKTYFDKKINENRLVSMYRRLQRTKFYRRGVIKAARWVAKRFPKAMAGGNNWCYYNCFWDI